MDHLDIPHSPSTGNMPRLRIDTTNLTDVDTSPNSSQFLDVAIDTPRTGRGRARTISQAVLPSFLSSSATSGEKLPNFPPHSPTLRAQKKTQKARDEYRKLLAHILGELQTRPRPPNLFDMFQSEIVAKEEKGIGAVVRTVRGAVAIKSSKLKNSSRTRTPTYAEGSSEDDELTEKGYSTDVTFDLMNQLKDVLIISQAQGWHIFDDDLLSFEPFQKRSSYETSASFRFRRNSFQSSSRSRSPPTSQANTRTPKFLSQCISILASVVVEDCRFQFSSPKLTRPPNALQALTLDIAQFLVHTHRAQARILCDIGFAMIPAFACFRVEMHSRLLAFFEEGILRGMLEDLRHLQGAQMSTMIPSSNITDNNGGSGPESFPEPIVAIQVDEAQDDSNPSSDRKKGWSQWSPTGSIISQNFISTNAPSQPLPIYYLSSIISPLLAAILDNVDLSSPVLSRIHRTHKLFQLIVDTKMDAYLNVLEVIAYHTDHARYSAISLLSTFWPKAVGHVVVGRPVPLISYSETLHRLGMVKTWQRKDHPYVHQFVPWRFIPPTTPVAFEGISSSDCRSCSKRISGFGLLCPFCMCAVHFNCYDAPDGSFLSHYPVANDLNTEKIAVHRFSQVYSSRQDIEPEVFPNQRHSFRLVNIFTVSLCLICRLPLWGCTMQGLRCSSCNHHIHRGCLTNSNLPRCQDVRPDSGCIQIEWNALRASFADFYRDLLIPEEELGKRAHEEVSVLWSILWTQIQLLRNGIESGSIVIIQTLPQTVGAKIKGRGTDDFELQYFERLYGAYLDSGRLPVSPALEGYMQENRQSTRTHSIMFDWPTLILITSIIKMPHMHAQSDNRGSDLLNVDQSSRSISGMPEEQSSHPMENVSFAHIRDALGLELGLHHDSAACYMILHLHHLGFLECADFSQEDFHSYNHLSQLRCSFPIPLGIDLSPDVETLVVAVEVCLKDLDVSVNEIGFLLLVRKLWPNGMASEYALTRLARTVLTWILNEDASLMTILRDFVARGRNLPGVPSGLEKQSWPKTLNLRSVPTSSVNNGGDYVACRKALLARYAGPWLLALHDQDINMYSKLLFEITSDLAKDTDLRDTVTLFLDPKHSEGHRMERRIAWADRLLRSILKLSQSSVTFSAVDDVLLHFLDAVTDLALCHQAIPSLPRLFSREMESSNRFTIVADVSIGNVEHIELPLVDPWRVIVDVASNDVDGLNKTMKWFCLFSSSGVDIPVATFLQISAIGRDLGVSFEDHALLAEASLSSVWMKSLGKQDLQAMIAELHTKHSAFILDQFREKENILTIHRFIRQSLAVCLLLYGCERARLLTMGMIEEAEIQHLPSRRKVVKRASMITDPMIVDVDLLGALSQYVDEATDDIRCLIAKFLTCLVTEATLMESYEIDNFILRNIHFLTRCAWRLYDLKATELNSLRMTFMLRILVVDVQPFQSLLRELFDPAVPWEIRLQSAAQLFRIILDVTSSSFHVEGRQWKLSVIDVFYFYFKNIWTDDREEIRLATDSWSQTLQPSHFDAIMSCWSESLVKAPIVDRMKLVSFLLQLRPHFPAWKVLSWEAIIETLMNDDYAQRNGDDEEGPAAAHLSMYGITSKFPESDFDQDPDMAVLRSSLILLSLQMIAEGISIDLFSILKIKFHLVTLLGFSDAALVPAPSGHSFHVQYGQLGDIPDLALPCINSVTALVDAFHHFDVPPSAMTGIGIDTTSKLMIGAIMVDVILSLFNHIDDLTTLPFLTTKALLQSIAIIIYKHDLESKPLSHLRDSLRKAVRKVTDLLLRDVSYELRQLVLSVCQAYLKRWPFYASNILIHQLQSVIKLISSLHLNGEDILVAQGTSFLESTLVQYSSSGLFYQLCKRKLDHEHFVVIRHIMAVNSRASANGFLWEAILRDTLNQIVSQPNDPAQPVVVENVKTYMEVVHHEGYTADLMQFVGRCLTTIIRNASEVTPEGFDPNPLISMATILVQYNKAQSRELIGYTETLLRAALVRFDVKSQHLTQILKVTSTLYRRTMGQNMVDSQHSTTRSSIALAITEVLSDALRGKVRVTGFTLTNIVEALTETVNANGPIYLSTEDLLRLATDGFNYLLTSNSSDAQVQRDLGASLAVASLILQAADHDIGLFTRLLNEQSSERSGRPALTVRTWNILALSAVQSEPIRPARTLFAHLSSFSWAYYTSLRITMQSTGLHNDTSAADVNHAYVAIKLWLLLARRCSEHRVDSKDPVVIMEMGKEDDSGDEDANARMVWNELWPPFEKLVSMSESEIEVGDISPIASLIWSSVAGILLFLRQMRSVVALESSSHIATLNRVKVLGRGESGSAKLSRAVNGISELPPDLPLEVLVSQAASDITAAEKLHALDMKRDPGRALPEKSRRDLRLGSL